MSTKVLFSLPFNHSIQIRSDARSQTSSDAGALIMRSVMDKTGILDFLTDRLCDPRDSHRITHPLGELFLQVQLDLIQGWGALGPEQLRRDPVLAAATSLRRGDGAVDSDRASQPTMSRLLGILGRPENLAVLTEALQKLSLEHMLVRNAGKRFTELFVDVDAMPIEAHGDQAGGAYNGHYKDTVFLPLFASCAESGDVLGAELRPGTQRECTDCEDFMISTHNAVKKHAADRVVIRMDAGFNSNAVCTRLEDEGVEYLMRLKKNPVLERLAQPYLRHRSSEKTYHELSYQAQSWDRPRRVILIVRPRPDELFDQFYFLITNLDPEAYTGEELAAKYSRRGKAELHQGEMKAAGPLSLSSSPRPKSHYRQNPIVRKEGDAVSEDAQIRPENFARLLIYLLTYQLLHIARELFHSPPPPVEAHADEVLPECMPWSEDPGEPVPPVPQLDESAEPGSPHNAENPPDPTDTEEPRLHIHSFRTRILKVGAQLSRHGRYAIFTIATSAVQAWLRFWAHFQQLHWYTLPEF